MIVTKGAYGRQYLTIEDARRDWNNDLDFQIIRMPAGIKGGAYINKSDHEIYAKKQKVSCRLQNGLYERVA